MSDPAKIGIVGTGWRAQFYQRLATKLPELFTLVGAAARRPESAELAGREWHVPVYLSASELVDRQRPDFVVASVPRAANPEVVSSLVQAGAAVLCETPPAPDADGLRRLWAQVGNAQRVQVGEQYLLMPAHAARLALVRHGVIGQPTSVQVSSTHGYHAVSMMRGLLRAGFEPATVRATRQHAPLLDPLSRAGWSDDSEPKLAATVLAWIEFGSATTGVYDFTDNQWHNQLRLRRLLIRGSEGELSDDLVVRLAADRTIVRSQLVRSQLGYDLNLDGYDTEHISFEGRVVYRNPFLGARLMDEEIAIASLMASTALWARQDGPAPYPLAEGCQDQLISLAIDEAVESGMPVTTAVEAWAR